MVCCPRTVRARAAIILAALRAGNGAAPTSRAASGGRLGAVPQASTEQRRPRGRRSGVHLSSGEEWILRVAVL